VIGVFDSGIGGLTVYREIARRFPALDVLYLGDTARVPYGTKSPETVVRYSFEAAHFLGRRGIEILVVACNTSSALALDALERDLTIPVIGVVKAGARRAAAVTRNRRIGVIGTPATIRSGAYPRAIQEAAVGKVGAPPSAAAVHVESAACPLFVPLAEEGWTDNAVARETARIYLEPLARTGIDTLVLGCTHYPILRETIAEVVGRGVTLVDSAEPVADEVGEPCALGHVPERARHRHFFVTDNWERFREVGVRFLGHAIDRIEHVDIVRSTLDMPPSQPPSERPKSTGVRDAPLGFIQGTAPDRQGAETEILIECPWTGRSRPRSIRRRCRQCLRCRHRTVRRRSRTDTRIRRSTECDPMDAAR
jgi:glutamate racemase